MPVLPDQLAAASERLRNLAQIPDGIWQILQRLHTDPQARQALWDELVSSPVLLATTSITMIGYAMIADSIWRAFLFNTFGYQ